MNRTDIGCLACLAASTTNWKRQATVMVAGFTLCEDHASETVSHAYGPDGTESLAQAAALIVQDTHTPDTNPDTPEDANPSPGGGPE